MKFGRFDSYEMSKVSRVERERTRKDKNIQKATRREHILLTTIVSRSQVTS